MTPVIAELQMNRKEWLEWLTKCCRFDPRKMFDVMGKPKAITELDENERAAVAGFEFYELFEGKGESRQAVGCTKKFKFVDRLSALALIGKVCHWYADRQEQTGSDGGPIPQNITVQFVDASVSPEEAYRRMVGNSP